MELYSTFVGMSKESYQKIRDIPFQNIVLRIPDRTGNVKTGASSIPRIKGDGFGAIAHAASQIGANCCPTERCGFCCVDFWMD